MITEYLNEQLLSIFLQERFNNVQIIKQFKFQKYKIDYFIPHYNLMIEFNGYYHYCKHSNILRDIELFNIVNKQNITLIFIPYFIQLDQIIINYLFSSYNIDTSLFNTYPHGFIDPKAEQPCNFCSLGLIRYLYNLKILPQEISLQITNSLFNKINHFDSILEILNPYIDCPTSKSYIFL